MERNLTEGSVFKNIVSFSIPYLLSYFLQTLYGMADLFVIGQFNGVESTTAVSIGSQIMHMLTVMLVGLAMGSTVIIGRSVGAGDRKQAAHEAGSTVTMFMALSFVLAVLLYALTGNIVSLVSTPADAVPSTISYLKICFLGIPAITAYNIISSILRAKGDSKSPMYFVAVACAANIALDYLFIGGMHMGAAGAALGTTLAQTFSVVVSLAVLKRMGSGLGVVRSDLIPRKDIIGRILRIGVPVALQDGFIQIAFIVITVIANLRGLNDAAAVGIVEKMICIIFLVPSSMLSAVSVISSQNIGAGKAERAKQTLLHTILIVISYGTVVAVIMQAAAEPAVGLFTGNADVIRLGGEYLRSYIWDSIFAGVHFCFSGYFCACGLSVISFLHNV
nr:MATE family efflux transporter [Synergistes sp.]